jgi:hypothetical protein
MKTRKTVIAVLTVMLLVAAALIVGCISPLEVASAKQGADAEYADDVDDFQIPAGKGVVKIKLSGNNARTILPDFDDYTTDKGLGTENKIGGMFFDVVFTNVVTSSNVVYFPGGAAASDVKLSYTAFNNQAVALTENEKYNVVVTAYASEGVSGTPPIAIAGWSSIQETPYLTGVTVGSGKTTLDANLIGFVTGPVNSGKFDYHITVPKLTQPINTVLSYDDTESKLEVVGYSSGTLAYSKVFDDIENDYPSVYTASAVGISPGYYKVKVTLVADACQTRVLEEAMHIYPAMTSIYGTAAATKNVPAPNQNNFTIVFESDAGGGLSQGNYGGAGETALTQGSIPNATITSVTNPVVTNYTFDGWYTAASGGSKFDLTTQLIFRDRNLWARYTVPTSLAIAVTFDFIDMSNISVTDGSLTFGYDTINGTGSLELSVTGTFSTVTWIIDGYTVQGTSGNTVTLDKTTQLSNDDGTTYVTFLSRLAEGQHSLTVYAEKADSSVWNATTTINIVNPD